MTIKDINDIINAVCPNDEDYEKPCISPKYLRQELEQLALDQEQKYLEQEPTTKNDLGVDAVSRQAVIDLMMQKWGENFSGDDAMQECIDAIRDMPSVTPQEPKTGHCRDCKWWKDSDGAYRRGIGAESKCPMNRIEVYEGNGYCYMFEPQESEDK